MNLIKLNQKQSEELVKCLNHQIKIANSFIDNLNSHLNNQTKSNLSFESTNDHEETISLLESRINQRNQLNSILSQLQ
jgi:hypothetical protein